MGYPLNGECYETAATFLEAWQMQFPSVAPPVVMAHLSSSVAGSTLSYSLSVRYLDSNVVNVRSGTAAIGSCPWTATELTLAQVYAIPTAAEAGAAWATGFLTPMIIGFVAWSISRVLKF